MFQIAISEQANTLMLFQRIVSMEAFRIMFLPKITRFHGNTRKSYLPSKIYFIDLRK